MTRPINEIKTEIAKQEESLAILRDELKEAQQQPQFGEVYVDQDGRAYIATPYYPGGSGMTLWRMGSTEQYNPKTAAFRGSYVYWTEEKGRVLTKVTRASAVTPFNVYSEYSGSTESGD